MRPPAGWGCGREAHHDGPCLPIPRHLAPGAVYQHHKGGVYTVICVATLEATMERVVVYQSRVDGRVWVRPVSDFLATVDGAPRFAPV